MRERLRDALRLALGTLTILRVRPPVTVDQGVAGAAMLLAPVVGVGVGGVASGVLLGARELDAPPLLAGLLAVGALAALTRALHLDGLADTADGLGSARPAAGALEVMRRSDIGPFGVIVLVLVLLVDAEATTAMPARVLVLAVVTGRAAIVLACRRGVPSARPDGLGAAVAGTVGRPAAGATAVAVLALGGLLLDWRGAAAVAVALVVAELLLRRCVRRLGGITGDVIGAQVETATAVCLVTAGLLIG